MLSDNVSAVARLEQAAIAGVVLLAAGSFVLSYDALHQLAVTNHVPRRLAWIWPLIVDGFIITASLAVLHAVLTGQRAIYPWLLVLAFSAMSVTFNVLHAPPIAVARLVAAAPPLTLVLSFELLMRQLHHRLSHEEQQNPPKQAVQSQAESAPKPDEAEQSALAPERAATSMVDKARKLHQQHTDNGLRLTGKTLGHILGISDGYARRLLRQVSTDVASP